jgi:hypothetical protein
MFFDFSLILKLIIALVRLFRWHYTASGLSFTNIEEAA